MGELENMRVLITGAGVRIGRQIALRFARAGARVVVHYNRSAREAESLVEELNRISAGHGAVHRGVARGRQVGGHHHREGHPHRDRHPDHHEQAGAPPARLGVHALRRYR